MLKRVSSLKDEAHQLEQDPSISSAPPPSKEACHSPSTTISCPPPQELAGPVPEASDPARKDVEKALEAVSPAASPASEEALPATCNLLPSVGGHQKSIQMLG